MRVLVDGKTEEKLNKIASENYIYGKGHTNTIAFLVRYYRTHGALEKVVDKKLEQIPEIIETQTRKVIRDFVANLFKPVE